MPPENPLQENLTPYSVPAERDSDRETLPFWERIGEQRYWLHILLFFLTLITTTLAGLTWGGYEWSFFDLDALARLFPSGLPYSVSLLLILTCHEFGHFFASMHHSVYASLPYFLPMPEIPALANIGTFGAMIRIKEQIPNSKGLFDIGVYGPLSGFVIALGVLVYGFLTVPPISFLYRIHPEYEALTYIPYVPGSPALGKNLLYFLLETLLWSPNLPPMQEMYHYPFLFAGWLGCIVTAINLLPVGQLDGGHIIYAMFGRRVHRRVARMTLGAMIVLGLPVFVEFLTAVGSMLFNIEFYGFHFPDWLRAISWPGWAIWAFILLRFVGIDHPPIERNEPLDATRILIGWISILVFLLCFTPAPFGVN